MSPAEQVNAKKTPFAPAAALALTKSIDRLIAIRGRKHVEFDLRRARPDDATLLKALLGPSGKLRAPVVRRGRTLLVGFDPAIFMHELV